MKIRGKPAYFLSAVLLVLTGLFAFDVVDRRLLTVLAVIALAASVYVFFKPDNIR
jgi:hypothetical protein